MPIITRTVQVAQTPPSARRLRYADDTEYRDKAKAASRRSYRKKIQLELDSCLYSLQFLDAAVKHVSVTLPNGEVSEQPVLTVPKTAELLQCLYQTLWRWIDNRVVPAPVLIASHPVYHKEEVRILIEEIGEHEKTFRYLRFDHHEVRERIERRILAFRKSLKR